MSHPHCTDDKQGRRDVIYQTYQNAIAAGDKNVYFIDGFDVMSEFGYDPTVDGAHGSDWGFYIMAKYIGDVIEPILK